MRRTRTITPDLGDRDSAFLAFGKAMAAWARLEAGFYGWFEHITLLDLKQAKPLYYSATNFKSRTDLLRAAIVGTRLESAEQDFIEEAVKVAVQYNSFRNKLAHGEFTLEGLIIESKHADRAKAKEKAIGLPQLAVYTDRFNILANLLWQARDLAVGFDDESDPDATLETCKQRATELLREVNAEKRR
jgi:hypothetical protein